MMMKDKANEDFVDFDFTRNDQFYQLSIPAYTINNDLVLYEIHLKDLVNNKLYISLIRFKQIKEIHQSLSDNQIDLPPFPKTHFWKKTNKNPQMIEQRKVTLQNYLNLVINDRYMRGYKGVKRYVRLFKNIQPKTQKLSLQKKKASSLTKSRSYSNTSRSAEGISIAELKKASTIKIPQPNKVKIDSKH